MWWEAKDKLCRTVEVANEKILEISDGWYIDSLVCPDTKRGKDINSLTLTVRRDIKERRDCKTCIHNNEWPYYYCDECCRNWEDKWEYNWEEG